MRGQKWRARLASIHPWSAALESARVSVASPTPTASAALEAARVSIASPTPTAVQGGVGKICLLGSPGPTCVVDEAVVVASWVEDGKRKVKLLGCEGKVFEVDMAVDMAASSVMGGNKKFKFKSSDGVVFEVDKASVMQSLTLQNFCLNCTDGIPVVEFNSKVLEKVKEYCEKHAHCNAEELKDWDADFIKVDQAMVQDLLVAGFDLNIKGLQILVCQAIADMLVGKTHEEIRKIVKRQE